MADTTALTTAVHSDILFGDTSLYASALAAHRGYAITLLMALDLPPSTGLHAAAARAERRCRVASRACTCRITLRRDPRPRRRAAGQRLERDQLQRRSRGRCITARAAPARRAAPWFWPCDKCSDPACEHRLFSDLVARRPSRETLPLRPMASPAALQTFAPPPRCCRRLASCASAWAAPATVTVENQTRPTACAEEDNVSLTLRGRHPRFRVEALQPAYLADIQARRHRARFLRLQLRRRRASHRSELHLQAAPRGAPRRQAMDDRRHDAAELLAAATGCRYASAQRSDDDFHLLQVFAKKPGAKPLEALVMYPADGYWRLKPLPLPRFGDGVYGSSFLMGPVETDGRPVVNIASIAID